MELMIPVGNHVLFRWLLGWLMPPKVSFLKLSQTETTRQLTEDTHVAQDFLLPLNRLQQVLEDCDKHFDRVYPIWLCPHDHSFTNGLMPDPVEPSNNHNNNDNNDTSITSSGRQMYVDVGVYGLPQCVKDNRACDFDMRTATRAVVESLSKVGGFQMLYGDVFLTRDEFEIMFPHAKYKQLRDKYGATQAFREVYDKMNVCI
jgi:delta24-sterol reductase